MGDGSAGDGSAGDQTPPGPVTDGPRTVEAVVSGRVQGVGFRWFAQREASRLGLGGWVANEADGSVRCEVTGPRPAVEAFIASLHEGPPSARVERVEVHDRPAPARTSGGFEVRSGAHRGD